MYERLFVEICGLFNVLHFSTIALFFLILAVGLYGSRKVDGKGADRIVFWLGAATTIMEVIKITRRISQGQGVESWIPLFYCSLFIFAIWLIRLPWKPLKRAGYSFITMGGILASVFFTLYPSTSLAMYPLLSLACLHSFVYHLVMSYCGLLILWKRVYAPQKPDSLNYFIFVGLACVVAIFINKRLGSNCMFMEHPFKLPILQPIRDFSPVIYMILVAMGQSSLMFWGNYWLYSFIKRKNAAAD